MSRVWFCADPHFGHRGIIKYRDFDTVEEHNEQILDNILSVVKKNDVLWILGDASFTKDALSHLTVIRDHVAQLKIVMGNHCHGDFKDYVGVVDKLYGAVSYKKCWLTHIPIHPEELRGRYNVFGHCHNDPPDDPRYYCVTMDHHDLFPIPFDKVIDELQERNK